MRACSIRGRNPPHGKYRAQWNDDYHHAWHRLLTGESGGYYQDYGTDPSPSSRARPGLGLRLSGRALPASAWSQLAAKHRRALSPLRFRQFSSEPRPDRQSSVGRSPCIRASQRGCAHGRARDHAACSDAAAPVHGRGMGINPALSVLLRFPRGARGRRAQRPPRGIQVRLYRVRAMRFRTRSRKQRSAPPCSIGMRARRRKDASGSRWSATC